MISSGQSAVHSHILFLTVDDDNNNEKRIIGGDLYTKRPGTSGITALRKLIISY